MRLLYIKVAFLSSDVHTANTPKSPEIAAFLPFTVCSYIHIFVFPEHATALA